MTGLKIECMAVPSNDRHHPPTGLPAVVWCLHCVSAAQEVQACELDSSLLATPLETWRSMLDVTAYFPVVLIAAGPTCSLGQYPRPKEI